MEGLSRRTLVLCGVGVAAMFAVGGVARGLEHTLGSTPLLRPPGGQDEAHFIANCIKCDRCRSACPLTCIGVSNLNDGLLNARTPKIDFKQRWLDIGLQRGEETIELEQGYCDSTNCGLLCIANCPTGALGTFAPETDWIGPAVIDTRLCLAYTTGCSYAPCVQACPTKAITFNESAIEYDGRRLPNVDRTLCNGCGRCELVCISTSNKSYSGKRAISVEHTYTTRSEYIKNVESLGAAEADALLDGEAGVILASVASLDFMESEQNDSTPTPSGPSEGGWVETTSPEHGK